MLYSSSFSSGVSRDKSKKKGTRSLMRTSDRFWKLFTSTGSVYAYLIYRQVNQAVASS
jgi:hypothetical protein